jgi:uncharacterized protein (UPF0147 family)
MTPLEKALQELCRGFEERKIPFLVGGGLGIYFKQVHLEYKLDHKPVIDRENWGPPRTTDDIDLYLLYEVIADKEKFGEVRTFLDEAGYEVLEQGKYFQFQKNISGKDVKIDVMAGNLSKDQKLHTSGLFRVRNKAIKNLHAHLSEESMCLERSPYSINIDGIDSPVNIPNAFTLLVYKLKAFADNFDNEDKNMAVHHAFDIYRLIAMMEEVEYANSVNISNEVKGDPNFPIIAQIVNEMFSGLEAIGFLRIQEYGFEFNRSDLEKVRVILANIFT